MSNGIPGEWKLSLTNEEISASTVIHNETQCQSVVFGGLSLRNKIFMVLPRSENDFCRVE